MMSAVPWRTIVDESSTEVTPENREALRAEFTRRLAVERSAEPNADETFCPVCGLAWTWFRHDECAEKLGLPSPGEPWG
jgi:hypothetical protein